MIGGLIALLDGRFCKAGLESQPSGQMLKIFLFIEDLPTAGKLRIAEEIQGGGGLRFTRAEYQNTVRLLPFCSAG